MSIEILAPAGDFVAVRAAILSGANAVYVGGKQLSARQNAKNLDLDELAEAVHFCHVRGAKLYLAVNTLIFDTQINDARSIITSAAQLGVDAIIAQDLAVVSMIKAIAPTMPIHASTQMTVHTIKGAQLLHEMWIKRVVLARELSLIEIANICKSVPIEVEVFVHGALCMSVSGQCYLSSVVGARSGNRGCCAGPCRLPFSAPDSDYALSLKDNCQADHVAELIAAGVTSLKIEGRMKRPEYVAAAASVYSKAAHGDTFELETLEAVFSRDGFTDGYITGKRDSTMFGYRTRDDVVSATNKLLKEIANTYRKEAPLVGITMEFLLHKGKRASLTVSDGAHTVTATCDAPEEALVTPLTADGALRYLSKLGATPFFITEFIPQIEDGLMLTSASVNALRREATDKLAALREGTAIPTAEYTDAPTFVHHGSQPLRCRFQKAEQVCDCDTIIIPLMEAYNLQPAENIILEANRMMFDCDIAKPLAELYDRGFRHLQCENLAHIKIGNELGYTLHGGTFLNCTNSLSVAALARLGVSDITLSFETELNKANRICSPIPTGLIAYGYLPLMAMRICPGVCGSDCTLTDRTGVKFQLICDKKRNVQLLNSVVMDMADRQDEMKCAFKTLYFTTETKAQCEDIIAAFNNKTPPQGAFTRGLYYRALS